MILRDTEDGGSDSLAKAKFKSKLAKMVGQENVERRQFAFFGSSSSSEIKEPTRNLWQKRRSKSRIATYLEADQVHGKVKNCGQIYMD